VLISSRKQDALEEAAKGMAGDVDVFAANAGEPDQAAACVAHCVERFGAIDVLVNNAATNPYMGPLMGIDVPRAEKTVRVNQQGVLVWTQEAYKAGLADGDGGAVINIASVGGMSVETSIAYYNVTKAAVLHLTRQMAAELAPKVRVNAIAPGLVKTDMARALWEPNEDAIAAHTPLRRLGEPEDIAAAALFLASDAASSAGRSPFGPLTSAPSPPTDHSWRVVNDWATSCSRPPGSPSATSSSRSSTRRRSVSASGRSCWTRA
jgi:NAD(P)-dependent dehydrogenase (short-subunit alcohol dehydrogenase family)